MEAETKTPAGQPAAKQRPEWHPDDKTASCTSCTANFSMTYVAPPSAVLPLPCVLCVLCESQKKINVWLATYTPHNTHPAGNGAQSIRIPTRSSFAYFTRSLCSHQCAHLALAFALAAAATTAEGAGTSSARTARLGASRSRTAGTTSRCEAAPIAPRRPSATPPPCPLRGAR